MREVSDFSFDVERLEECAASADRAEPSAAAPPSTSPSQAPGGPPAPRKGQSKKAQGREAPPQPPEENSEPEAVKVCSRPSWSGVDPQAVP